MTREKHKNLWDVTKSKTKKFIALHVHSRKEGRPKINDLRSNLTSKQIKKGKPK